MRHHHLTTHGSSLLHTQAHTELVPLVWLEGRGQPAPVCHVLRNHVPPPAQGHNTASQAQGSTKHEAYVQSAAGEAIQRKETSSKHTAQRMMREQMEHSMTSTA
eukprot:1157739-Pelagomonas_calceolata.AAC.1